MCCRTPLAEYYFHDPRLILVPIEQLTPAGMRPEFAELLVVRRGWDQARVDLFNAAFSLYWSRTAELATRTCTWAPPRLRHVGLATEPLSVRPYVQLLNTSTWLLYESDFDPRSSHAEFGAYMLVHGDRMALTGEVTMAALCNAAYWFSRTQTECAAFAQAAAASTRPNAAAFRALAAAIPWLRQLYHQDLRPLAGSSSLRAIPGTGLLAVDAGWVPQIAPPERVAQLIAELADQLEDRIATAPRQTQQRTAADIGALSTGATSPGAALVHMLLTRMPDYQANLLAQRFLNEAERETYVRQNIRTLRPEYAPEQLWRMLARYLIEYQYLRFSAVSDARTFFLANSWFDADFLASGILNDAQFDSMTAAVAGIWATYAVDETRFHLPFA